MRCLRWDHLLLCCDSPWLAIVSCQMLKTEAPFWNGTALSLFTSKYFWLWLESCWWMECEHMGVKQFVSGFCLIYFHNCKQELGLKSEALKSSDNFHVRCLCEIMAWNWPQFDGKGRNERKVKWAFLHESTNMLQKSWWRLLNLQFTPKWLDLNSLSKPIDIPFKSFRAFRFHKHLLCYLINLKDCA